MTLPSGVETTIAKSRSADLDPARRLCCRIVAVRVDPVLSDIRKRAVAQDTTIPASSQSHPPAAKVFSVKGSALVCEVIEGQSHLHTFEVGTLVRIDSPKWPLYGIVESVRLGRRVGDAPMMDVGLVGEIVLSNASPEFVRGVSRYPSLGAKVAEASLEEETIIYKVRNDSALSIGHHRHAPKVPARLMIDRLLGNHFAILGSTGSGKSCAVTVVLNALMEACPYSHIVIIDPHNEYGAAFGDRCQTFDLRSMRLPIWMMNFEEIASLFVSGDDRQSQDERAILKRAVFEARRCFLEDDGGSDSALTVDSPVPFRINSVIDLIDDEMGTLNKVDGIGAYRRLIDRIRLYLSDSRFEFLFGGFVAHDNMAEIIGEILRVPADGKPMSVIDISGAPGEIADVVVSFLCRMVFETALWSLRDQVVPVLLVCEEAHRYVPGGTDKGFGPSRKSIERIAKEGRKYGIALGLVSQRPADLSASSLTQCGTIMALRLSNERDQAFVRDALPEGGAWLIDRLPSLTTGEAVIVGEASAIPQQVVLTRLLPAQMPSCQTPSFINRWRSAKADGQASLDIAVRRWRGDEDCVAGPVTMVANNDSQATSNHIAKRNFKAFLE